ncbi:nucleotidyltransferase domain-containing protein [Phascolarctobacterium faecium]|nr:nucleotidyltransferase domain-containing protein [Phascolarctobacterium faecium]MDM8108902.1 nucleotidyltransferase domain-containing protein [Phascolarctobacterium faecium]
MMKGNVYTVNDIKEKLLPVFKKHNIKKAILFGSYAKGSADNRSDIDIMVDSNLRGLAFYGLLEDVVNTIGKSVDLLDKQQIKAESKVEQEINATGVVIYG